MITIFKSLEYGNIEGIVIDRKATLISIFVYPEYRNKGYGTELLLYFLQQSFINGAVHIELDDCSSCYRNNNNIYLKYGLVYTDKDNHMEGNIRNIINNIINL